MRTTNYPAGRCHQVPGADWLARMSASSNVVEVFRVATARRAGFRCSIAARLTYPSTHYTRHLSRHYPFLFSCLQLPPMVMTKHRTAKPLGERQRHSSSKHWYSAHNFRYPPIQDLSYLELHLFLFSAKCSFKTQHNKDWST